MRIAGGTHRGRPLKVPEGRALRPTSDRARQAVFNILAHAELAPDLAGASVLDVFAGAGAMGLEALSRGAGFAAFIDNDALAIACARANAARLGFARRVTLLKLDATQPPPPPLAARAPAAVAFLDPPYGSGLATRALAGLMAQGWLAKGALAVVEVAEGEPLAPPPGFAVLDQRVYGRARVVFLRAPA